MQRVSEMSNIGGFNGNFDVSPGDDKSKAMFSVAFERLDDFAANAACSDVGLIFHSQWLSVLPEGLHTPCQDGGGKN